MIRVLELSDKDFRAVLITLLQQLKAPLKQMGKKKGNLSDGAEFQLCKAKWVPEMERVMAAGQRECT